MNLEELKAELILLKNSNDELVFLVKKMAQQVALITSTYQKPEGFQKLEEVVFNYDELKKLLETNEWPKAASEEAICNGTELQKNKRAKSIVDLMITQNIATKKFLDYGCGEGYVVNYIINKTAFAIGYDIQKSGVLWDRPFLTLDRQKVKDKGPYDVILLYDVLDHASDPEALLKDVVNQLDAKGTIYVRCHPWFSRHGGHLYNILNKAFINLVFTDEELKQLNLEPPLVKIKRVADYNALFNKCGLKVKTQLPIRTPMEPFFKKGILAKRISERLGGDIANCDITFVDFQLIKSDSVPIRL